MIHLWSFKGVKLQGSHMVLYITVSDVLKFGLDQSVLSIESSTSFSLNQVGRILGSLNYQGNSQVTPKVGAIILPKLDRFFFGVPHEILTLSGLVCFDWLSSSSILATRLRQKMGNHLRCLYWHYVWCDVWRCQPLIWKRMKGRN